MAFILSIFLAEILAVSVFATPHPIVSDPIASARRIVACILLLTEDAAPYIGLLFIIMGAFTYISAAEDSKQRILGKKFIVMGILGMVLVSSLVLIAASPPFDIPTSLCDITISGPDRDPQNPEDVDLMDLESPQDMSTLGVIVS